MSLVTSLQNGVQTGLKTGLMLATPIVGATAIDSSAKAEELTDSFVATSGKTDNGPELARPRPSIEAYSNVEKESIDILFKKLRSGETLSIDENLKILSEGLGLIDETEKDFFRTKFNDSTSISKVLPTKFSKGLDKMINATVLNPDTHEGREIIKPYLNHPNLYRALQGLALLNGQLIKEGKPLDEIKATAKNVSEILKSEYRLYNNNYILVSNP